MSTIEFERTPDHVIWESKLSKAVADTYGRPFRLQQLWMLGQDTYQEFEVTPEHYDADMIERAKEAVAAWQEEWETLKATEADDWHKEIDAVREHSIDFELLLVDLYGRGVLPAGSYLMKIWW